MKTVNAPFLRQRRIITGIITASVVVLLAGNLASWAFLLRMRGVLEQGFNQRLKLLGETSLAALDTDDTYALLRNGDQLAGLLLERSLTDRARAGGVERILLTTTDGKVAAGSDTDLTGKPVADFVLTGPDAWHTAVSGSTVITPLYSVAGQRFKSALLPVTDRFDGVIGVLCTEADAGFLNAMNTFRNGLVAGGALSLAAVAFFLVVLYRSGRSLLAFQRKTDERERLAMVGGMAARITHEIRNPLGIIKNTAQLIRKRYGKDDDEIFMFIEDEVRRLNELITGFLGYARERELSIRDENLGELVADTVNSLKPEFARKGITLSGPAISPGGTAHIPCDRDALRQVLLNLLLNAQDAVTAPGGSVTTAISIRRKQAVITVTDNGTGIPDEVLPDIFTPFFSTKTNGSGLGLAVSYRLMERHGGTISAAPATDGGTVFTVTLPVA